MLYSSLEDDMNLMSLASDDFSSDDLMEEKSDKEIQLELMAQSDRIVIFGDDNCSGCRRAKSVFDRSGVKYTYYDFAKTGLT